MALFLLTASSTARKNSSKCFYYSCPPLILLHAPPLIVGVDAHRNYDGFWIVSLVTFWHHLQAQSTHATNNKGTSKLNPIMWHRTEQSRRVCEGECEGRWTEPGLTISTECRRRLKRDAKVDLQRIDHWGQHGGVGGNKSDAVLAVSSTVVFHVHSGWTQVRGVVRLHNRHQSILVKVDVKLPKLGVLEVCEVEEDHEPRLLVILPRCGGERGAVARCQDCRLQNARWHGENAVRLDVLCGRLVHPPWVISRAHLPPETAVWIFRIPSPNREKVVWLRKCTILDFTL